MPSRWSAAPSSVWLTAATRTPGRNAVSSGSRRRNSCQSGPQQYERNGKGRTPTWRPSGAEPSRTYQRRVVSCTHGMAASMYPAAASSAYRALCTARPTPRSARWPVVRSWMVTRPAPARCAASAVAQPAMLPPTTATSAPAIWMRSLLIRRLPPALSGADGRSAAWFGRAHSRRSRLSAARSGRRVGQGLYGDQGMGKGSRPPRPRTASGYRLGSGSARASFVLAQEKVGMDSVRSSSPCGQALLRSPRKPGGDAVRHHRNTGRSMPSTAGGAA